MTSGIRGESASGLFADALAGADGTGDPRSVLTPLPMYADPTLLVSSARAEAGMPEPDQGADRWSSGPDIAMPFVAINAAIDPAMLARAEAELRQQRAAQDQAARQAAATRTFQEQQHALTARRDAEVRSAAARARPPAGQQLPPQLQSFTQWLPKSAQDVVRNAMAQVNAQQRGAAPPAQRQPPPKPAPQYNASKSKKKSSSAWGVLVFIIVVLFATGLGQRIVEALTQLFNR
jgi:hypothetical protein